MTENHSPISRHLDEWLSIRKASKSIHTYEASRNAVKAFLKSIGDIPLPSLTEKHYSAFLDALKAYDARTEQLYATLIYGWFVYLSAKDIKPVNLAKLKYARENEQRHPGKRLRKFDRRDLELLKKAVAEFKVKDGDLTGSRAKAMVMLALETGLRVSEMCKLKAGNLDFEQLTGTVIGKRNKERQFFFTKKSSRAIQVYLHMRKTKEPDRGKGMRPSDVPIFVSHSKRGHKQLEPMDTDTARLDLYRIVTALVGTPKHPITPHVLRHFAGNELRKATGDLEIVRTILGHDSIETTRGYMHVEDEEAEKAYRKHFGNE